MPPEEARSERLTFISASAVNMLLAPRLRRSVNLALTPFTVGDVTVHMLDTPGYADFTGDLRAGLRAANSPASCGTRPWATNSLILM